MIPLMPCNSRGVSRVGMLHLHQSNYMAVVVALTGEIVLTLTALDVRSKGAVLDFDYLPFSQTVKSAVGLQLVADFQVIQQQRGILMSHGYLSTIRRLLKHGRRRLSSGAHPNDLTAP